MVEAVDRSMRMAWDIWSDGSTYMHVVATNLYHMV
jgi:hypothetical protein